MFRAHIRPSWESIQQTGMHQQFPALIQLAAFLQGVLPDGWRIWVRPNWCSIQFDLVILHPIAGIIFYAVNDDSDNSCATPETLQNQFFKAMEQSLPDMYKHINNHPSLKLLLRFCLYSSKEPGKDIRHRILINSKIHMILGNDDLTWQQRHTVIPFFDKVNLSSLDRTWLDTIESGLYVLNDYWPKKVTSEGKFRPPQSIFVDYKRNQQIREFCEKRKITKLLHFTHISNLASILELGLRSRAYLEKLLASHSVSINDKERIDQQETSCSLSLSFPNYRMFYARRQYNSINWVVLELDSAILWNLDCAFCTTNAANAEMRNIAITERQKPVALERMFAHLGSKPRSSLNIPDCYPTDPQAEVLVFDPISPRYIRCIHFYENSVLSKWRDSHLLVPFPELRASKDYFAPRCDYSSWTSGASDTFSQLS